MWRPRDRVDVPVNHWAWRWIEALADSGLTRGCAESLYCPSRPVIRAEMAVFLVRVVHGAFFVPPQVTSTRFDDVPASHWAAAWIEQLAAEGITTGCTPTTYCPEDPVNRDQMAVFLSRAFRLPLP